MFYDSSQINKNPDEIHPWLLANAMARLLCTSDEKWQSEKILTAGKGNIMPHFKKRMKGSRNDRLFHLIHVPG